MTGTIDVAGGGSGDGGSRDGGLSTTGDKGLPCYFDFVVRRF